VERASGSSHLHEGEQLVDPVTLEDVHCLAEGFEGKSLYHRQAAARVFIEPPLSSFLQSRRARDRKETCAPVFLP
jgi:hypothetical protein